VRVRAASCALTCSVRVAAQARNALEVVARAAARSAPAEVHQARAGANREAAPAQGHGTRRKPSHSAFLRCAGACEGGRCGGHERRGAAERQFCAGAPVPARSPRGGRQHDMR
jgi:hypothetical protein